MCSHGTPRRFRAGHALGGRVGGKARRFFARQGTDHSLLESRGLFYWRVLLSSHLTFVIACNESPSLAQRSGKRSVSDVQRPIWIAQNYRMTLGVFCTMCLVLAIPTAQLPATTSKGLGYALAIAQNLLLAELWVRAYRWSIGTKARPDRLNRRVADMDGARCSGLRSCQPLGLGRKRVPPGPFLSS